MIAFVRQVRAEWTKLRSVRRWTLALLAAGIVMVLMSLLGAAGGAASHAGGPESGPPAGPEGTQVRDNFRFVHQEMRGDGSVTARVASLTSRVDGSPPTGRDVEPWTKAGIMVKAGTKPGSSYVALLATAGHGVRLQHDFLHDRAVRSAAKGGWLRLTRTGSLFKAFVSDDGTKWTRAGTVRLPGVPEAAQVGVFAAAPPHTRIERHFGALSVSDAPAHAIGVFDHIGVTGAHPGPWTGTTVGRAPTGDDEQANESSVAGGTISITGTGEIGPLPRGLDLVQRGLQGVLIGLLVVVAVGVLYMTSEYRHGLVRATFAVSPRRGRMLAAKSLVLGTTVFVLAAVSLAAAFPLAQARLRTSGFRPPGFRHWHLSDPEALRAVLGSAVLVAAVAVLALAFGSIVRRGSAAIAVGLSVVLVPQILAPVLPLSAARLMLSVTPAAGFAVQQSSPRYTFTAEPCLPNDGCFPLSPWAGLAVPCGYAAVALLLAWWLLRRRDA